MSAHVFVVQVKFLHQCHLGKQSITRFIKIVNWPQLPNSSITHSWESSHLKSPNTEIKVEHCSPNLNLFYLLIYFVHMLDNLMLTHVFANRINFVLLITFTIFWSSGFILERAVLVFPRKFRSGFMFLFFLVCSPANAGEFVLIF